ncbi:MAG: carbohydrate ABC transporter permease [Anaerolineae bacterium]
MILGRTLADKLVDGILYALLVLLALACLVPFMNVASVSISSFKAVSANRVNLFPIEPHIQNYTYIMGDKAFIRTFGNSTLRVVVGVSLSLLVMVLTAYPLSRDNIYMPGRTVFKFFLLFGMMFSGGLIPTFLAIRNLGLYDSFWVLVIPGALNIFSTIIVINYFRGIPDELWEAAMLDGANHFQVLFRVFVPISTPVLATVTLFSAVGHWNAWFDALVYLKKAETWPLQTYLYGMVTTGRLEHYSAGGAERAGELFQQATPEGLSAAMLLIAAIPIILVYPFLQRYFVHGLTLGAVKE